MENRVRRINSYCEREGSFIAYWIQGAQRSRYNHALEYAVLEANRLSQPLIVFFNLVDSYPEANLRHYYFMGQGLIDLRRNLKKRGIVFVTLCGDTLTNIGRISQEASLLICDKGYMKWQKELRRGLIEEAECPLIEVESNLIVPIEETSDKEEYAARTIRPKINRKLDLYLYDFQEEPYEVEAAPSEEIQLSWRDMIIEFDTPEEMCRQLDLDASVPPTPFFKGGEERACEVLEEFVEERLSFYSKEGSDPSRGMVSRLSPYLHFGHISPLYIAQVVLRAKTSLNEESVKDFLEELIVRRELSFNFVYYNDNYDQWRGITYGWAYDTLSLHSDDPREYLYTVEELEEAVTHDQYWNASMREMTRTGFMHGYMRMYWCKKILEWSKDPVEAYQTAIYLNNKYFLDGRDPNSYTGVAWCFGKHDRAWAERPIYGKVRCMTASGLKRKFDMDRYIEKIDEYKV